MAAPPSTTPHSDDDRDSLAHAHLNDPNFDLDAELRRRSNSSNRRRAAQLTALKTAPSIRRRPAVVPPPSSPPRSGFPLIPHYLPTSPPLSSQPSNEPQLHPSHDFAPNPQLELAAWTPSVSLPMSSSISDPNPALSSPISNHGHSTATAVEDEYYDMVSIAPSTSPHRFSMNTYPYDKKRGSNDDDYDMEMDFRSEMDFEEYAFSFPSTTTPHSKRPPTPLDHVGLSFPTDIEDDSPYPEVRAAVANTDDPSMPTNTFRMWLLGLIFTVIVSALNQFFSMRYPSVAITALVAQLLALPAGRACERIFPTGSYTVTLPTIPRSGGPWTKQYRFSLNPGPFNVKEHCLITVMANVVAGGAYATDIIAAQRTFYDQQWSLAYQLLLVISTQTLGFSLAGVCRRFLVWPSSMIWPATLVNTALLNTLHSTYGRAEKGHMSRERFFFLAFLCSFLWYFLPGYLFTALSVFSWVCWIRPQDKMINALFGYTHGLGMGVLTFDWSMIAYTSSPLVTPWWAEANVFACLVIVYWIIVPILYSQNVWFSYNLPIASSLSYDRSGHPYDSQRIIKNGEFNLEAYREYSPLYISISFAISYGLSFAALTATIVHTFLWYRHDIARQFRSTLRDESDVHARLMQAYPEVPQWWYALMGFIAFVLGVITIVVWDTKLPVWAYLLSLLIAIIYLVPVGMLQAITNQQVGLNVITELVVGYCLPERPVAMMIFKTFGYITMAQALAFVSDLKFGHYMKIPPRLMFMAQVVATLVSCFVVVGVQAWMFDNIPKLCSPDQVDKFTCPGVNVFGTASLIWGGIGPARQFSSGQLYHPLLWFFLVGAVLPVPFYYASRKWPQSWFKYVNLPVFMTGTLLMPPATGINYSSWTLTGFVFQYWIRRHHFRWWSRYNYILSAALDTGVALGAIIIFFCLQYPNNDGFQLDWWGNTVHQRTLDGKGTAGFTIKSGPQAPFGLTTWT